MEKVNTITEFWIFKLVEVPSFFWIYQVDFLDQIYPKRVFVIGNWKSEHRHWILHMRIDLGTKLYLRLTVLVFWAKFAQKRVFLVKNLNFASLRVSMVVSCYIKLFCTGADRHSSICNKTRQRRVRHLLMRVKAHRHVRRVGAQACKARIIDGVVARVRNLAGSPRDI